MKVEQENRTSKELGQVTVITPVGDVDMHESPKLRSAGLEAIAKKPSAVVIDFSSVAFIDSSGVATLVEAMKECKALGVKLVLAGMSTQVLDVFELARLDKIFSIVPTLQEALSE